MKEKNLLVIRLSAMGDVAMTVPAVASVVEQYPDVHVTMLTNERFAPLFETLPRVEVFGINPDNYAGLSGLLRLFKELKKLKEWYAVVDLHDVIRSKVLRTLFRRSGVRCVAVEKDRTGRRKLTARKDKQLKPLSTVQRLYAHAFDAVDIHTHELLFNLFPSDNEPPAGVKQGKWLGIAPFARYEGKIYPENQMEEVIKKLSERKDLSIFLFGNGEKETAVLKRWEAYPNVKSMAGKMPLREELQLISWLDAILTMDSANMHLASLVNTPVGRRPPARAWEWSLNAPGMSICWSVPTAHCIAAWQKMWTRVWRGITGNFPAAPAILAAAGLFACWEARGVRAKARR